MNWNKVFEALRLRSNRHEQVESEPPDRAPSVARQLNQLARAKRWDAVMSVMESSDADFGWMARHAPEAARITAEIRERGERSVAAEALGTLMEGGFRLLDVQLAEGGLHNVMCARIALIDSKGERLRLFWKVLPPDRIRAARHEAFLFAHVAHDALSAPRYVGVHDHDSFLSVFYAEAGGVPASRTDLAAIKRDVMKRLWTMQPHETLARRSPSDHVARALSKREMFSRATSALDTDLPHDRLRLTLSAIYERMPRCLPHGDLGASNALGDASSYTIIDWDKWSVARVGYGLSLLPGVERERWVDDLVVETAASRDCDADDIRLVIALYNFVKSAGRKVGRPDYWGRQLLERVA